ncbi:MAG: LptF/LptG family permease [Calditrichaceae bacterium]|nr:LptF/LptG family permease [Calditrichaceae bacterium]
MKKLNIYIIKEHIAPFLFALSVIMFILLMNFLVKHIDEIFGKGLGFIIIFKLIVLNLSWMLALAVPMATLVAVLMAYGRFSADNEITILKSSGISIFKIIRPSLYLGVILTVIMIYFSDQILPESNHQAKKTFRAVREKKPTLQLEEHIFYEIQRYNFLVDNIEKPLPDEWLDLSSMLGPEYNNQETLDRLKNISLFDRSDPKKLVTIIADEGYMVYSPARRRLIFTLYNGEFHEYDNEKADEYQRSYFNKHTVYIPAEDFELEEKNSDYRSDREMNIKMMTEKVDEYKKRIQSEQKKVSRLMNDNFIQIDKLLAAKGVSKISQISDSLISSGISKQKWIAAMNKASRIAERNLQQMKTKTALINQQKKNINRYEVEIYKKISIPFASIVFVLIGAPLGVMSRKGSMGVAISISIGFFLLYWAFLIGGEDLADRRFVTPFLAMWSPNIIVGIGGLYLSWRAVKEVSFINWDRLRKFTKIFGADTTTQEQADN